MSGATIVLAVVLLFVVAVGQEQLKRRSQEISDLDAQRDEMFRWIAHASVILRKLESANPGAVEQLRGSYYKSLRHLNREADRFLKTDAI